MKIVSNFRIGLTDREMTVLKFAQEGLTSEKIAEKLEIRHGSVHNYLTSIYEKLGVNNRAGAVSKAIELGLLE